MVEPRGTAPRSKYSSIGVYRHRLPPEERIHKGYVLF